ncbi:HD domain-containing protein [Pyrococcus abyssi]|uniref:Hydrolase, containing HD domain, putative n=1 Tax=Pyrococcus abyssi (strain GE5 / Orsay) TaxID=272844 RepID=Q9UXZ9_PYRAB|nr:HD domain-containing protein [Pyrococcus abyssi]CAB50613.1 hydrolase, containing HD domain, putative [Pyrococcus abyssi GE5]CCE71179.1 TPA: Metal-dependent phosphohydrolase, HD superfamily [Pyrococcus abyssi GE5]
MSCETILRKYFKDIPGIILEACRLSKEKLGEGSHGFSHTLRVLALSLCIGAREGGNLEVIALSAILHDIARPLEDMGTIKDHAKVGAEIARKFLETFKYGKIDEVCHAIEAHRFSGKTRPRTLEAKILSDADKLDALGAIGIARVFMYSGEKGRSIQDSIKHFEEKILRLKDMMYTKTAKEIAERRYRIVEEFIKELKREIMEC